MKVQISFRHMEASDAIRDYSKSKIKKLFRKYAGGEGEGSIVLSTEKYWHIVEMVLNIGGFVTKIEERSEDMYQSIDLALDKAERKLRRYKERQQPSRSNSGKKMASMMPATLVEEPRQEQPDLSALVSREVLKTQPLTIEEALQQVEVTKQDFFIFQNAETKRMNVLHKVGESQYSLIESLESE